MRSGLKFFDAWEHLFLWVIIGILWIRSWYGGWFK